MQEKAKEIRGLDTGVIRMGTISSITRLLAVGYKDKNSLPIASKYFIKYLTANIEELP